MSPTVGAPGGGTWKVPSPHGAGLDVHKDTVVVCVRHMTSGTVKREVRTFKTTTTDLLALSEWLASEGCTHVVMEATGVYWKPVWHILSDGDFVLTLANAARVKNVLGRKTDINDATWLADLLAHGLVRASFVPDGAAPSTPWPNAFAKLATLGYEVTFTPRVIRFSGR